MGNNKSVVHFFLINEEGGGFRMGSMGIPVVDSFRCLAKLYHIVKFKNKIKFLKKRKKKDSP